jgi:hypothetical protein
MSQDHYVAQTYLRNWCDPEYSNHIHAIRKSDLKRFPAHPYTVCREKDGDKIVGWLDDETALGKFRAMSEPGWDQAVKVAGESRLTDEQKLNIAGLLGKSGGDAARHARARYRVFREQSRGIPRSKSGGGFPSAREGP